MSEIIKTGTDFNYVLLDSRSELNVKAVVAAFNQEKTLVGAFSVITNLRMELFGALIFIYSGAAWAWAWAGASGSVAPLGGTHRH